MMKTIYLDLAVKGEYADRRILAKKAISRAIKKHSGQWAISDTRKGRGVYKGFVCFRLRQEI